MSDTQERITLALANEYTVKSSIGKGGMALVYLAHDVRHGRQVAVKVMRPELTEAVGKQRFLNEIQVIARLAHPHILPLYDSGIADGLLYYIMPYVQGESLSVRIRREVQLGINEAVMMTRQVALALQSAHEQGIVHRDVKPENILIHEGEVMLADFGVALALSASASERLTATGIAVGTPRYMSPEQSHGSETLDARSDIYSLGCVLFEMLAGEPPFTGPTPQAIILKRISGSPPDIRRLRDTVSDSLSKVVTGALAKVPSDRYASAGAFAEALASSDSTPGMPVFTAPTADLVVTPEEQSIAVLPFANLSTDPENEYFCDGMTDELINALSHLPALRVAGRTSSFSFKGKRADAREIGERLHVATVLEGSVRRAGDRVRITVSLSNVADGRQLWSERFDRRMSDTFELQDEIAVAIVHALRLTLLGSDEEVRVDRGTDDLEAYHLYLKGRHFLRSRALPKAIEVFDQAIAKDPSYSLAYCGISDAYCFLGVYGYVSSKTAFARAKASAERAVQMSDNLAEAHCSVGVEEYVFGWQFDQAERSLRRAIEFRPDLADAHAHLSQVLAIMGRVDEAKAVGRRAIELDPLSPLVSALVGFAHHVGRDASGAVENCEQALDLDPFSVSALWVLGLALLELDRHTDAIAALEKAATYSQRSPLMLMCLGGAFAAARQTAAAHEVLGELARSKPGGYSPPATQAWIQFQLGDLDAAFESLNKGLADRNTQTLWPACFPGAACARARADQRFKAMLEPLGLESMVEYWAALD